MPAKKNKTASANSADSTQRSNKRTVAPSLNSIPGVERTQRLAFPDQTGCDAQPSDELDPRLSRTSSVVERECADPNVPQPEGSFNKPIEKGKSLGLN